jgi:hypothetical protein
VLLCNEFAQLTPKSIDPPTWVARLTSISGVLTASCRAIDPQSTDETLEEEAADTAG